MNAGDRLRLAPLWWGIGFGLGLAIVTGSLVPRLPDMMPMGSDKVWHFAGYGMLSFWFVGVLERRRYPLLAIVMLSLGIAIEIAQHAMGMGRSADWRDIVANSLGIAVALGLAYAGLGAWLRYVERRLGLS
jgi:VanZ family protein